MLLLVVSLCTVLTGAIIAVFWMIDCAPGARGFRRGFRIALLLCAAMAIACYTRFGALHEVGISGRHNFHFSEMYHYFLGSRYLPEWGYFDLYKCTVVALRELADDGVLDSPQPGLVRDLRNKLEFIPAAEVNAEAARCRSLFTPRQWDRLKKDLQFLVDRSPKANWWTEMVLDCGFNPSPAWWLGGGALARFYPLNERTWLWLGYFDVLIIVSVAFLIARRLGFESSLFFLVVFGTVQLWSYHWTGGSFFRHTELLFLAVGLLDLLGLRYLRSGLYLGVAAAIRVFPICFVAGASVPLFYAFVTRRDTASPLLRLWGGCAASLGLTVGLSCFVLGPSKWVEWAENISGHKEVYFANHLGFKKAATYAPQVANQSFFGNDGLHRYGLWNRALMVRWDRSQRANLGLAVAICAVLAASLVRGPPVESALLLGSALLFFFSMPANYYFIYLAIYAAVLLRGGHSWCSVVRFACLCLYLVGVDILAICMPDSIQRAAFLSAGLMVIVILLGISYLGEHLRILFSTLPWPRVMSALCAAVVILVVLASVTIAGTGRWRPNNRAVMPPELQGERRVVDSLDVGDLVSEGQHAYTGLSKITSRRLMDRYGRIIDDGCRIVRRRVSFRMANFEPAKDAELTMRSDFFFPAKMKLYADGRFVGDFEQMWPLRSIFGYLKIRIPGEFMTGSTITIDLELVSGKDVGLFYVWVVQ